MYQNVGTSERPAPICRPLGGGVLLPRALRPGESRSATLGGGTSLRVVGASGTSPSEAPVRGDFAGGYLAATSPLESPVPTESGQIFRWGDVDGRIDLGGRR